MYSTLCLYVSTFVCKYTPGSALAKAANRIPAIYKWQVSKFLNPTNALTSVQKTVSYCPDLGLGQWQASIKGYIQYSTVRYIVSL